MVVSLCISSLVCVLMYATGFIPDRRQSLLNYTIRIPFHKLFNANGRSLQNCTIRIPFHNFCNANAPSHIMLLYKTYFKMFV